MSKRLFLLALALSALTPTMAFAQTIDLNTLFPAGDASVSGRIVQLLVVMTVLSVAPGLLMMVTSFARFVIALSFLRSGLGLQTTPSNMILVSLALFMTMFVMAPTFQAAWDNGVKPMVENKISQEEGYTRTTEPFRAFMKANVREKDIAIFQDLSAERFGEANKAGPDDLRVLIPAFMVSELRRGFEIGFLVTLPFLVIDLVVATIMTAMGMMMMPPTVVSLPLKILFFVLVDGWSLLVGALVKSFT
ncbi:Flagellar transport protein FliP [Hyphomicrobium sp. GJ21]|jgi:flagellar biosynthetic protein FliP|uniref:flagellar type III secretion system pore protein FliP n=1 Tax=Hyphomicrobium sp. GJ21 TaxID=113574 RepID=UPI000622B6E5|nr:flagellar type III secretion system pore protein FliP [Hyphomicrobium sp. GJ21]MBN9291499.1 flagellar type III secretion system pore protein FliP [Hyphomicrobium denitrificans]CEJ87371.1 Flagellar transport protein FliP [Hyphomicrobium sp. GJ21]